MKMDSTGKTVFSAFATLISEFFNLTLIFNSSATKRNRKVNRMLLRLVGGIISATIIPPVYKTVGDTVLYKGVGIR